MEIKKQKGKLLPCRKIVSFSNFEFLKICLLTYYFEIGFYRNLTNEESEQAKRGKFNFDHPGNFYLRVTSLFLTLIYVYT